MKHLSRFDIEAIAAKYVKAYMELPDVRNTKIYRIDPELLLEKVLGLTVEYQHLSYDGSILGMTSFTELGVQVLEDDDMAVTGFITIVAAVLLCVCIHEFIHMLGYKLCRCNCVLVYSKPLITISVMGSEWLTKKQALFVTLLPFLVIDALSFFVFLITKNSLLLMWLLLINTALAGSDLVCVFVLAKTPKSSLTLGHYMRKQ